MNYIAGTNTYGETRQARRRRVDRVRRAMRRITPVRDPAGVVYGYVVRSKVRGRTCPFFTDLSKAQQWALDEKETNHG